MKGLFREPALIIISPKKQFYEKSLHHPAPAHHNHPPKLRRRQVQTRLLRPRMAAIHTPVPGEVEQAPLPPVNLAQEPPPAGDPERHWRRHAMDESRKASIGLGLIIAGAICFAAGIYILAAYGNEYDKNDFFGGLGYAIVWAGGLVLSAGGIGMLIPGIILRSKYGGHRY